MTLLLILPEKLTSSLKYRHHAIVHFTGPFPLDALRYDRCYPLESVDTTEIEQSMNFGEQSTERFAVIVKYSESANLPWSAQMWRGQSRLKIYPLPGSDVTAFRNREIDGESWLNRCTYGSL